MYASIIHFYISEEGIAIRATFMSTLLETSRGPCDSIEDCSPSVSAVYVSIPLFICQYSTPLTLAQHDGVYLCDFKVYFSLFSSFFFSVVCVFVSSISSYELGLQIGIYWLANKCNKGWGTTIFKLPIHCLGRSFVLTQILMLWTAFLSWLLVLIHCYCSRRSCKMEKRVSE